MALKFSGTRRLARPLGQFIECLDISGADAVVAVPLTKRGLLERGYNQSMLLAKAVSSKAHAPLLPHAIRKVRETEPQAMLKRDERLRNLRDAFVADKSVEGMKLVLVDDVMTTGATANECSKALLKAGAKEVFVVTLARAGL